MSDPDYYVTAWNEFDDLGNPIIKIRESMTEAEYEARVKGKFAYQSCALLRPVSRKAIDRALAERR